MNQDIFEGKWKEVKGKLQAKWGKITDDELQQIEGNEESAIGFLQKHYGHSREDAKKALKELADTV